MTFFFTRKLVTAYCHWQSCVGLKWWPHLLCPLWPSTLRQKFIHAGLPQIKTLLQSSLMQERHSDVISIRCYKYFGIKKVSILHANQSLVASTCQHGESETQKRTHRTQEVFEVRRPIGHSLCELIN